MGRKRYRIRKRGGSSITRVRLRESHMRSIATHRRNRLWYPLYETWQNIYNFENIMESMDHWRDYSDDETSCLTTVARLMEEVAKNENKFEINQATNKICEHILLDTVDPVNALRIFTRVNLPDQVLDEIASACDFYNECDRVSTNFSILENKYDTTKLLIETLKAWPVREAIYRLCESMHPFIGNDIKTAFPILMENTLYGFTSIVQDYEIPMVTVTNNIIDYCMVNENCKLNTFSTAIKEGAASSYFVDQKLVEDYLGYLKKVSNGGIVINTPLDLYVETVLDKYNYIGKSKQILAETVFDTANEWLTKIKLAPVKSMALVKEAIRAAFVTSRLQDLREGTHNALSIAFYCAITLGAFSIGMIPGILAAVTSFLLHRTANKEYIREAIDEWRDHKYSVSRRLKSAKDEEQKKKLSTYLEEVDKNIELLEDRWDKMRDKTRDEIVQTNDAKHSNFGANSLTQDIDPNGNYSPSAFMG